jgi:hypothetical protein
MAGIAAAAAIGAGGSILGGLLGGSSAKKAAKIQAAAAREGIAAQKEMFAKQVELQEPFRQAGITSQNQLMTLLGLKGGDEASGEYGSASKAFGMDQFNADPGYAFRLSEGMKALERSAAARGGLLSGQTLKGINRYGQDMGSQEYQNAFNRYQVERNARLNPLQSLMGAGQTATNQLSGAAGQLGTGLAQGYGNMGQAQASGYVGMGQAAMGATQGISNAVQGYYNNQFMNNMLQSRNRPTGTFDPIMFQAEYTPTPNYNFG